MNPSHHILKKYWGFNDFRPLQEEIIESVLNGRDTVALLPTGGGKSLCFQVPALVKEGICLVVSPLVALMQDQVNTLTSMGIKAMHVSGGISYQDLDRLLDNCIYGNYKFLYLSPERLEQPLVRERIAKMNVCLIAADEAHCISQWGNDFRPSYKNVGNLRELHPGVPFIALTATATPDVLADTIQELGLQNPEIFKSSFLRKNLAYLVWKEEDKLYRIEKLLQDKNSAIIYTRNRKSTEEIYRHLVRKGHKAAFFHGGITSEEKKTRLKEWLEETTPVMVATNAFGMGIDKGNVKTVIHYSIPESLESYFQEAGRAGRDGDYARAVLLYNDSDPGLVKNQFLKTLPTTDYLKLIYKKLNSYFYIAYGEGEFSSHSFNFGDFCEQYDLHILKTYNALQSLDQLGIIKLTYEFGRKTEIKFLLPSAQVLNYLDRNIKTSLIGKTMLRIYTGIFESPTPVNLELVASKSNQKMEDVVQVIRQMEKDAVISLKLETTDATLTFIPPREDDRTINRVAKTVELLHARKTQQVAAMLNYIENDKVCKSRQLLAYFDEKESARCGICNVCTSQETVPPKNENKQIAQKILLLLEEFDVMTSRDFSEELTFPEDKILFVLRQLLDTKKIRINTKNQYFLY